MKDFDVDKFIYDSNDFFRNKLDNIMLKSAAKASDASANTTHSLVIILLIFIIYLLANISLGLFLADIYLLKMYQGMLIVLGVNILFLLLWIVLSSFIKNKIRNKVSHKALEIISDIDTNIDYKLPEQFKRSPIQMRAMAINRSSQKPYLTLLMLEEKTYQKAMQGQKLMDSNLKYISQNLKPIASGFVKSKLVELLSQNKYIAKFLELTGISKNDRIDIPDTIYSGKSQNNTLMFGILGLLRTIVLSLVIAKSKSFVKSWVLKKIGIGKKTKTEKRGFLSRLFS